MDTESSDDSGSSALDDDLEEEHKNKVAERKKRSDEAKKKAASAAKAASAKTREKAAKQRADAKTAAAAAAASSKPRRSPRHKKSAKNKRQRLDEDDGMEDDHLNGLYGEGGILGTFVNLKGKALYLATIKGWVRTLDSAQYKMETVQGHHMALLDMARSLDIDKPENLYKNELCHHIAHARMVQIAQEAISLAHYGCSYPHALLQSGYSNAEARQRKVRGVETAPSGKLKKMQPKTDNGSHSVDSKKSKILKFTLQGDEDAPSNIHGSSEDGE